MASTPPSSNSPGAERPALGVERPDFGALEGPGPALRRPKEWLESGQALLDPEGRILAIDESLGAWLGLPAGEGPGIGIWDRLRALGESWPEAVDRLNRGAGPFVRAESHLDSDGEERTWFRLELARSEAGQWLRLCSILSPPSELPEAGWGTHLRSEAAGREMFVRLLRAESQLEKLARHWPGVIFSQRPDFSFEFVGGRIEELTGLSAEAWCHQPGRFWDVVHESDSADLQHQFALAAHTGQPLTSTFRVRHQVSGRVSYVLEHRQPSVSRSGLLLGYEGVWLDVTRQTLAEKLLTSAAWKETLAVVTMGLAHDFSNVIAGIHSLSESFHSQLDESHPFWEGLGLIKKSAMQASQLVHRIVHLHLGKPGERNFHDLNQVVGELLELVRKVIPRRIAIVSEFSPDPLPVYVDTFEFRQVIINLAINAADAMPERGKLVFRTSRMERPPSGVTFHGDGRRFPCACLSVADTGCGIKSSHIDLIFDPFFTTKTGSKGSGLGLYNARLFAEKHQGAIGVESEIGRGSTFHVCLPEVDLTEPEPTAPGAPAGRARLGLLVLGQEGAVLDAQTELLRVEGFHVATAHTPERVGERLATGEYVYRGLVILAGFTTPPKSEDLAAWRRAQPGLRVIIQPFGRGLDELDAGLVQRADLVLTPELSQAAMLEKLRATLTHEST